MSGAPRYSQPLVLGILAGALLLAGLVVDLGVTQPRARELRALNHRRAELFEVVRQEAGRARESQMLMRWMVADSLENRSSPDFPDGPISYVDGLLAQGDLTRLELSALKETTRNGLQRTQLQVRVIGGYAQILDFMRRIEQGRRLVVIDAFSVEATENSRTLEARFSVSIYDPEGRI
jgi:hypothetical protein